MDLNPSNPLEIKLEAVRFQTTTSANSSERARRYRLAGALIDSPRDTEMFLDLATIFDRLAHDFKRLETASDRLPS